METFGLLGFVFGSTAMSFAIIAWSQISGLSSDLEDLKQRLAEAGVLKDQPDPDH